MQQQVNHPKYNATKCTFNVSPTYPSNVGPGIIPLNVHNVCSTPPLLNDVVVGDAFNVYSRILPQLLPACLDLLELLPLSSSFLRKKGVGHDTPFTDDKMREEQKTTTYQVMAIIFVVRWKLLWKKVYATN